MQSLHCRDWIQSIGDDEPSSPHSQATGTWSGRAPAGGPTASLPRATLGAAGRHVAASASQAAQAGAPRPGRRRLLAARRRTGGVPLRAPDARQAREALQTLLDGRGGPGIPSTQRIKPAAILEVHSVVMKRGPRRRQGRWKVRAPSLRSTARILGL